MAREQFKGVYASMDFPDYVYREYPKRIKLKNGREVEVNSQAEELRMIDEVVPVQNLAQIEQERDAVAAALLEKDNALKAKEKEIEELKAKLAAKPVVNPNPVPQKVAPAPAEGK